MKSVDCIYMKSGEVNLVTGEAAGAAEDTREVDLI